MGASTGIAWTEATFNPWWGCVKISDACRFCYAAEVASRGGHDVWGDKRLDRASGETIEVPRRFFGDHHWSEPVRWNRAAAKRGKRMLVFCGSMCDYLEDRRDLDEQRARLRELVRATPWLDWQMVSKRPENGLRLMGEDFYRLPQVWAGATVENRATLARVDALRELPASIRFLSCEPLLESLVDGTPRLQLDGIHWVIGGGESGSHLSGGGHAERALVVLNEAKRWTPRPEALTWARELRDLCAIEGVAFFWKQWGGPTNKSGGHMLDGETRQFYPRGSEPQPWQTSGTLL